MKPKKSETFWIVKRPDGQFMEVTFDRMLPKYFDTQLWERMRGMGYRFVRVRLVEVKGKP